MPEHGDPPDVCPECGEDYLSVTTVDAREDGGNLFRTYTHDLRNMVVTESCIEVLEE